MAQTNEKSQTFSSYCKLYESWKKQKHGVSGLSSTEVGKLRESYSKVAPAPRLNEAKRAEIIARHRERLNPTAGAAPRVRESTAPKAALALNPKAALRAKIREHFAGTPAGARIRENAKVATKPAAAVSVSDASKHIRESRKCIFDAKRALREGNMDMAGEQLGGAADAVNAVGVGADLPPEITSAIGSIKAQIDDLAVQVGIDSPVDLADPAAGIPPVDGAAGATTGAVSAPAPAPAGAPLFESQKAEDELKVIRERMAKRREELQKYREESGAQNIGRHVVDSLMVDKFKDPEHHLDAVSKNDAPTQIPEMPTKTLEKGTAKSVVRWPNKEISAPAEPTTITKDYKHKAPKIAESLDEQHVTKYLDRDHLNFREIYGKGLLG